MLQNFKFLPLRYYFTLHASKLFILRVCDREEVACLLGSTEKGSERFVALTTYDLRPLLVPLWKEEMLLLYYHPVDVHLL